MVWLDIFHLCYELTANGYTRLQWPQDGAPLQQSNLVIEALRTIKNELTQLLIQKQKKYGR